jgi:hypothetical protein
MDRRLAEVALGLAEGVARNDDAVEPLLADGFDSVEQAAHAHAYLAGFLLVVLAKARNEDVSDSVRYVRSMLHGEGTGSGMRSL